MFRSLKWKITHQWDYLCWLCDQAMRQFLVVFDQVANIDVAVIFLEERILAQLVSAGESVSALGEQHVPGVCAYL